MSTNSIQDAFADIAAATNRMAEVFAKAAEDFVTWGLPLMPPRTRRRIKKRRKIAAHHLAKLDRIPAWKRPGANALIADERTTK